MTESHECFITGESIQNIEDSRFTWEFDAWVSERGQQMIDNAYATGELENNREWEIIYGEWYAQDEADAARWDMALRHLDYDNKFDGEHE
tara:strand:+ start:663 stop:932 length:270 start_codon:yes stop_codon:yes gene_type:complete